MKSPAHTIYQAEHAPDYAEVIAAVNATLAEKWKEPDYSGPRDILDIFKDEGVSQSCLAEQLSEMGPHVYTSDVPHIKELVLKLYEGEFKELRGDLIKGRDSLKRILNILRQ